MIREQEIVRWAIDRGIFDPEHGSSNKRQADKTQEELDELFEAILKGDIDLARDAIGDIIVTLVLQCQFWNLSIDECVEAAYQEIKDRRGQMVNGFFVKESIDDATPAEWDEAARIAMINAKGAE
jgi:NTP pyrophosphatase (non-canonical NTP hydrolase)